MNKRQRIPLCLCNVAIYFGISGMVGLMPIYLTQLGAGSAAAGFFLAFAYFSLAVSNVVGGRLADHLQRRKALLIVSGALAVPIAWIISEVTALVPLLLLTGCLWFMTGIAMTMATIMVGLSAPKHGRGRIFGIVTFSTSLGLLLGNLCSGRIADAWGYHGLFTTLAAVYVLIPLAGALTGEQASEHPPGDAKSRNVQDILGNRGFQCLLVGSILAQAANIVIVLSRSLIMHALHFDATVITTVAAAGGLATMPLPLLVGWLSDRLGRKPILIACFLTDAPGLVLLAVSSQVWQFLLASALQTMVGTSIVVGSALLTDAIPEEALGTALALLNATPWIGIVIGLSAGGPALGTLRATPTLLISALLSLLATLVLLPIQAHHGQSSASMKRTDRVA